MRIRGITSSFVNKIPKVLLIMVVLFGLSLNRNQIFGYRYYEQQDRSILQLEKYAEQYFGNNIELSTKDQVTYAVLRDGTPVGQLLCSSKFSAAIHGYAGETPMVVIADNRGNIIATDILTNSETKKFVDRIRNHGLFNSWDSAQIGNNMPMPDIISGATLTSSAIIDNVRATLQHVTNNKQNLTSTPTKSIVTESIVLAVVILSLICFFIPRQTRWLRIPMLLLSIGIIGVWQGAFVSVNLLYNWTINGTQFASRFALISIVLCAVIIPLILNRSWYCNYLCPFGATQELLGMINKKKLTLPHWLLTAAHRLRQIILLAIVVLLFTVPNFDPSQIEPFTIFMLNSAAISVIVIASISLVGSLFIQRMWCRLLCPTGEILSLLQRKFAKKKSRTDSNAENNS